MCTLQEYLDAQKLLKDYKVCGTYNGGKSGYGCNQIFKIEEVTRITYYGNTHYWCSKCYEQVKDEW